MALPVTVSIERERCGSASFRRRRQRIDGRLHTAIAEVFDDFGRSKGFGSRLLLRLVALQFDALAGLQIGTAGYQRIGLVLFVVDETQSVISSLDAAGY